MKKVAVIGLGIMGHGIADNFLKNGFEVYVWNRSLDKTKDLEIRGAHVSSTPKVAAASADIIFEVSANDDSSHSIWTGEDGILAGATEGSFVITCATLSIDWVSQLASLCETKKLAFFDMPMTGSRIGAETGRLVLLVGGAESRLNEIQPELSAISRIVRYFGPVGSGTKYKLILNSVQAVHVAIMGQALSMAKKVGLDQEKTAEALIDIPGGVVTKAAWESYVKSPDPISFSVDWITKDLEYAKKMVPNESYPLLEDALKLYHQAIEKGLGSSDWTVINESI